MFAFKASTFLAELEGLEPELLKLCRASVSEAKKDLDFIRRLAAELRLAPAARFPS